MLLHFLNWNIIYKMVAVTSNNTHNSADRKSTANVASHRTCSKSVTVYTRCAFREEQQAVFNYEFKDTRKCLSLLSAETMQNTALTTGGATSDYSTITEIYLTYIVSVCLFVFGTTAPNGRGPPHS